MPFIKVNARLGMLATVLLVLPGLLYAAGQAFVLHQNLSKMVAEADRIYRGTVMSIDTGELTINGASVPTVTYRFLVTDHFKGEVDQQKDDQMMAELRVVGTKKKYLRTQGNMAQLSVFPEPPDFKIGSQYLLLTNAPNVHGLSNTIGLAQGHFRISYTDEGEVCANDLDNLGLFKDMGVNMPAKGAIAYTELASIIRAEIAGGQQ